MSAIICRHCRFSLRCWFCGSFELVGSDERDPPKGYEQALLLLCRDCGEHSEHLLRPARCEDGEPIEGLAPLPRSA